MMVHQSMKICLTDEHPTYRALGSTWLAVDTETTGLHLHRDRLCLVQLYSGGSSVDLVRFQEGNDYTGLKSVLKDPDVLKIFHYARFDMAILYKTFGVMPYPIYCTKLASRLVRTYTNRHSLKALVFDLLGLELDKQQQCKDWADLSLSEEQQSYAASDVIHLKQLEEKLTSMVLRENRMELLQACLQFLPVRVKLDLEGWEAEDLFAHH